ncbi:hypothetical protein GUJ93_ZPchr0007g5270 [Zizania palustris]|uniref:Uncharacterized protein n=1 Tax=Zizania palustris TaxID=103762 RepID=A0A8J5VN57_ZIZPA|nr:hypothetical protein GUJ93_ZPchr0007g5270 [Zizania palustris]
MISCFSKAGILDSVMKLFNRMKETVKSALQCSCTLAKRRCVDEAKVTREMLDDMLRGGLSPLVRTFHALFEVFDLLDTMKALQWDPEMDTYIMLIRKFCRCIMKCGEAM